MNKIKLIIDFFRLWILWGDRKEAWQDAKINNDSTFQEEMQEFDADYFEEPFISKEFIEFIERQELLDEAYNNYESQQTDYYIPIYPKDEFINKCKTDLEFSEKWGLKIEERELSWEERFEYSHNVRGLYYLNKTREQIEEDLNYENIPTKLITMTYNDKTIESYE
jgi:hypothetical protein